MILGDVITKSVIILIHQHKELLQKWILILSVFQNTTNVIAIPEYFEQ